MKDIFNKAKYYTKGVIDAALVGTIICLGVAFWDQKEKIDILTDQVEEQSALIQRFGWPRTNDKTNVIPYSFSKAPKGKAISTEKPSNPIGFC